MWCMFWWILDIAASDQRLWSWQRSYGYDLWLHLACVLAARGSACARCSLAIALAAAWSVKQGAVFACDLHILLELISAAWVHLTFGRILVLCRHLAAALHHHPPWVARLVILALLLPCTSTLSSRAALKSRRLLFIPTSNKEFIIFLRYLIAEVLLAILVLMSAAVGRLGRVAHVHVLAFQQHIILESLFRYGYWVRVIFTLFLWYCRVPSIVLQIAVAICHWLLV